MKSNTQDCNLIYDWKKVLTEHFSNPCYADYKYTQEDMLREFLGAIRHGMQNNDFTEKDVYFKTESSVTCLAVPYLSNSENDILMIDIKDLESFDYVIKENQSGYDFIDENLKMY